MWPFEEIIANPIPVIIGFFTIAAAFYISFKNKKLKSFRYEILTYEPILTSSEELRGKIKIYYETTQNNSIQIKDGFLFIIRLINDGNVPIKSDDFYEPVSIFFGPYSEVLSAEIIETNPRALNAELDTSRSKHKIYLKPLLLNQQDSITIKVLLTGFRASEVSSIKVDARIVDVPEVKAIDGKRNYLKWPILKKQDRDIFMAAVILFASVVAGFVLPLQSSDFELDANFITAQAGEDADVSILVEHEPISSFLMNHSGFIKANFPDYERCHWRSKIAQ